MGLLDKLKKTVSKKKAADKDDGLDDDLDFSDIEDLDDFGDDRQDTDFTDGQPRGLDSLPTAEDHDGETEDPEALGDDSDEEANDAAPEEAGSDPYAGMDDDIHPDDLLPEGETPDDREGDDHDEDEWDEDDEEGWAAHQDAVHRRRMLVVIAAAFLLVGGVIGGAGWWFLSGPAEDHLAEAPGAEAQLDNAAPEIFLPPRGGGGGLNQFKDIDEEKPVEEQRDAAAQAPLQAPDDPTFGPDPDANNKGFSVGRKGENKITQVPQSIDPSKVKRPAAATGAPHGGEIQSLNQFATKRQSPLEAEFGLEEGEPSPGAGVVARAASYILKDSLPELNKGKALGALDPALLEPAEGSPPPSEEPPADGEAPPKVVALPKLGDDGRAPWQVYARPYAGAGKQLAIIVQEMGMSTIATEAVIARFPADVSLSFSPYGVATAALAIQAREAGHEVWLSMPMEPINFPFVDPGPLALFTAVDRAENESRMRVTLAKAQGYVGVTTDHGSQFTVVSDYYKPVLEALKGRGLAVVDVTGTTRSLTQKLATEVGMPWVRADMMIGNSPNPDDINQELLDLEKVLGEQASTVVTVMPYPHVLKRLAVWLEKIQAQGISLAPASALLKLPPGS